MVVQTLFFDSGSSSSNVHRSTNGDSFTVFFKPPIPIPADAKNCYVSLTSARIVNNFDNIKEGVNDKFHFKSFISGVLSPTQTITLDSGMYSVSQLNASINRKVLASTGIADAIKVEVEYSTNIIIFTIKLGWVVEFAVHTDTFRELLGFTAIDLTSLADNSIFESTEDSTYADSNAIQVHSKFGKSNINGTKSDVLEVIAMTVAPGFIMNFMALHPNLVDASDLVGTEISNAYFTLTNGLGNPLVVPDNWSLTMRLQYDV